MEGYAWAYLWVAGEKKALQICGSALLSSSVTYLSRPVVCTPLIENIGIAGITAVLSSVAHNEGSNVSRNGNVLSLTMWLLSYSKTFSIKVIWTLEPRVLPFLILRPLVGLLNYKRRLQSPPLCTALDNGAERSLIRETWLQRRKSVNIKQPF